MELLINESPIVDIEVAEEVSSDQFITANTQIISYSELRNRSVIPVFTDNESTISHPEFIHTVESEVQKIFKDQKVLKPCIRVSHPIKGRVPEAMGKPVNMLVENEKTIYFERMGFVIDIPDMMESVNGNTLSLSVGGVRAYNTENLHSRKSEERFKVFVGFKNKICTNLCIFTDGYAADIRVRSLSELRESVSNLVIGFDADRQLSMMRSLSGFSIDESQFAKLVGKAKMHQYLPAPVKKNIPAIQLGDSQVNAVVRDYHNDKSFCRDDKGNINLWKLYNLFTAAVKTSYLDTFLDRNVASTQFISTLAESLRTKREFWYLH